MMKESSSSTPTSFLSFSLSSTEKEKSQISMSTVLIPSGSDNSLPPSWKQASSVEPPLSLNDLMSNIGSVSTSITPPRSSQLPDNLAVSLLTCCSYETLQNEYDMATWRMYERIRSKRSQSNGNILGVVNDTEHDDEIDENQGNDIEGCEDSGRIFELEL